MVSTLFPQRVLHLYERHGRRLPPAAQFVLVILVGVLAARWVWALVPVPEAARWQPAASLPAPTAAPARSTDVNTIIAAQLFGQYQAIAGVGNLQDAPETRLSLTLLGILAGTPEESRALIASSGGEEKPYGIGDDVVPGASLQAIFPDRVILSRNGQMETLRLNRDAPSSGGGDYVRPAAPGPSATASLGQVREQILADPTKASTYIRVQPANVNGQLRGYRVYPGREREAFTESGLRPGDLVTSINGIQLDDNQKALQMLGDLSKAGSISVTVERGGQQQNLNFSFN